MKNLGEYSVYFALIAGTVVLSLCVYIAYKSDRNRRHESKVHRVKNLRRGGM
jgi:hypothetical protein